MLRNPPDVLITTPESLYLMLTSRAREFLVDAEAVIVDEIHAVARTKRGAHLALTLERLEHLAGRPLQRIGLSATQRPLEEVGRFLVGRRPRLRGGGRRGAQAARPEDPRARGEHARAGCAGHRPSGHRDRRHGGGRRRPDGARPRILGGAGGHAALDLAGDLPRAAQADRGAPLDDRLREQPARGRAPGGASERARRRGRRACRHSPRPPWVARARGAPRGRGPPQVGRAALPRGHLVARARHRHGRRGPRDPGGVAEVGHRGAPADRPRRATAWARCPRAGSSPSSAPTSSSARWWSSGCATARSRPP